MTQKNFCKSFKLFKAIFNNVDILEIRNYNNYKNRAAFRYVINVNSNTNLKYNLEIIKLMKTRQISYLKPPEDSV